MPSCSITAGNALNITVTAQDPFNNTATGYTGMVHFSFVEDPNGTKIELVQR